MRLVIVFALWTTLCFVVPTNAVESLVPVVRSQDDHVILSVPADLLGRKFLLISQAGRTPGLDSLHPGFRGLTGVVQLQRIGGKLVLQRMDMRNIAQGSPAERAVHDAFSDPVLAVASVISTSSGSDTTADVTPWFTADLGGFLTALRNGDDPPGLLPSARIDPARTLVLKARSSSDYARIDVALTFVGDEPVTSVSLADPNAVTLDVSYSLMALPAAPMTWREADDRVNFDWVTHKRFGEDGAGMLTRGIVRWRLEPGRPAANGLVYPQKPITFYLDPTVPSGFRDTVRAAVLAWNPVFEAAGFEDAIRVADLPPNIAPDDPRYAIVRWIASSRRDYVGYSEPIIDPHSGEILGAAVRLDLDLLRRFRRDWIANGGAGAPPEGYDEQAVRWMTMHEIGHALGLTHNFAASAVVPRTRLADGAWISKHGTSGSVMDYPGINVSTDTLAHPYWFTPVPGDIDRFAIIFGYSPKPVTSAWLKAEASVNPFVDEPSATGDEARDPRAFSWDLSDDPLGWAEERAERISRARLRLASRPNTELRSDLDLMFDEDARLFAIASRQIGGLTMRRDHDSEVVSTPVPAARQREALRFLAQSLLADDAFQLPAGLGERLGFNTWFDEDRVGADAPHQDDKRIDYPLGARLLGLRKEVLSSLLAPPRLSSFDDQATLGMQTLSVQELLAVLDTAIRKNGDLGLQQLWRKLLLDTANNGGVPAASRIVARNIAGM